MKNLRLSFMLIAMVLLGVFITPSFSVESINIIGNSLFTAKNTKKLPLAVTVSLIEVEETRTPPPGSNGTYPVGKAVVRLRVENLIQQPLKVNVEKIEITSPDGKKVLMKKVVGLMNLGGLEIKESGFQLVNETGFSNYDKVKATVVYRYGNSLFRAKSTSFKVSLFP